MKACIHCHWVQLAESADSIQRAGRLQPTTAGNRITSNLTC